jgi:hypothetical protein
MILDSSNHDSKSQGLDRQLAQDDELAPTVPTSSSLSGKTLPPQCFNGDGTTVILMLRSYAQCT